MIKRLALIGLCLATSACGTVRYRTMTLTPPTALMADCPETPVAMVVNGDIIHKVRALRVDLKNCNSDKAALRAWAVTMAPATVMTK